VSAERACRYPDKRRQSTKHKKDPLHYLLNHLTLTVRLENVNQQKFVLMNRMIICGGQWLKNTFLYLNA
jgi:hypothetical protein